MTQQRPADLGYGKFLRDWRHKRRFSQLSFGLFADVSPRHLSFLEKGRSRPSREMVLKLAARLDMPKSEVNRALRLAGFSPAYLARPSNDADLAPLQKAISHMLTNHMPYPAISLDRLWTIKAGNEAAMKLLHQVGFSGSLNLIDALCGQTPAQSSIINWQETFGLLLARVQAEMLAGGPDEELEALVKKMQTHFETHKKDLAVTKYPAVIPTRFAIAGQVISVFSTFASFGSVQDVVLDDWKVEFMFPLDAVSKAYFLAG